MQPRVSEPYKDALHDAVEAWINKHVPAELATELREQLLDADDVLIPRLTELTEIEMRRVLEDPRRDNA